MRDLPKPLRCEILPRIDGAEGDSKSLALAKVVAGLLGVSSDEIFRREMPERRRRQTHSIAGLSVLALALAGLAIWAQVNRRGRQAMALPS